MTHTKKAARLAVVLGATAALLSIGGGSVLAGEITGNGTLKDVNGRSECAFSGQEDLQFYYDDANTMPRETPTKGEPGHAQSWGQIDKATRDFLATLGLHPSDACNPSKASHD